MKLASRKIRVALGLAAILSVLEPSCASAKNDGIETAGTAVAIVLPVAAGGISIYHDDWVGVGDLVLVTGATVGTAFGLKYLVKEERPDHSDNQSFPSDTAALAFAPAQYLWDRYGWQYGVPAYAAAAFSGYSRVEARQHHWWDVATSAGLAFGYSRIFTRRFIPNYNVQTGAYVTPHAAYLALNYQF